MIPRARKGAVLRALLAGTLLLASCGRESETVTGPHTTSALVEGTPVPRMSIIRVQRGTPTRTPSPTPPPAGGSPTATPTNPAFPTSTPPQTTPTPTPTQTPGATITVHLRAVNWAWQFVSGADAYGKQADGSSNFTFKKGQRYELHVYNGGIPDPAFPVHIFSGNSAMGVSGGTLNFGPDLVQTFIAPAPGSYVFLCNESGCGRGHDSMHGTFTVIP